MSPKEKKGELFLPLAAIWNGMSSRDGKGAQGPTVRKWQKLLHSSATFSFLGSP